MVRIALCFFGQPRYVNNLAVPQSYQEQFNHPEYEVDAFGHCWYSRDAIYSSSSWTQNHEDYKSDQNTVGKLYNYYNFKRFLAESPKPFHFVDQNKREMYTNMSKGTAIEYSEYRENNTLSQLYSIQTTSRLVPNDYDFYVICRYDTVLVNMPDFTKSDNNKVYLSNCGLFPDPVITFGPKYLDWSRNLFDQTQEDPYHITTFIPEEFKRCTFESRHTMQDVVHCPMFGYIQRSE